MGKLTVSQQSRGEKCSIDPPSVSGVNVKHSKGNRVSIWLSIWC